MKNKIWKFGVYFLLLISFIVSVLGAIFTREPIWLTLFLSACLLYVTYLYVITARKTMWHQALLEVNKDYRSGEMRDAVQGLWDFQRKCENEVKKEEETMGGKELEEKIKERLKGMKIMDKTRYQFFSEKYKPNEISTLFIAEPSPINHIKIEKINNVYIDFSSLSNKFGVRKWI